MHGTIWIHWKGANSIWLTAFTETEKGLERLKLHFDHV